MTVARPSLRSVLWLCAVIAVLAAVLQAAPHLARSLLAGAARLNLAAIVCACAVQVLANGVCGLALHQVARQVDLTTCMVSRWVRDAASNLLCVFPGAGEAAGARLMALQGQKFASALGATAVDVGAETLAQVWYTLLGLALAPSLVARLPWGRLRPDGAWVAAGIAGLAAVATAAAWTPPIRHFLRKAFRNLGLAGVNACIGLHLAAWILGGIGVWIGSQLMGFGLSLPQAISIECLVYAGRALFFFIPAGVGVQEAGFVAIGALMNIAAADALALALLLRVRDVICGVPALGTWAYLEGATSLRRKSAVERT